MVWTVNPVMEWSTDGSTWYKISDHGRSPLEITVERIERKQRMANGTLRRYTVAKKHSFSCSWENLPNISTTFLANGQTGAWMETFHNTNDNSFKMRLRQGQDSAKTITDVSIVEYEVMISEFSKEITKRGPAFDLWSLNITLEEV